MRNIHSHNRHGFGGGASSNVRRLLPLALLSASLVLFSSLALDKPVAMACHKAQAGGDKLQYNVAEQGNAVFHTVVIPPDSGLKVLPALSETVDSVETFAKRFSAKVVVNGGYFDPLNSKTTSHVLLNGKVAADPRQNERLTGNASLTPYLERFFDRSEFRVYQCGKATRYDITSHQAAVPSGCKLTDAMGAGPALLPEYTVQQEAFIDTDAQGRRNRDPIGVDRPNARTAVGIRPDGAVILLMVSQKVPDNGANPATTGLSLPETAAYLKSLGAEKALNLDGGSSSSLWVNNNAIYGKLNPDGSPVKRKVKTVLMVKRQ